MSNRFTQEELLRQYGEPLIRLDLHATRTECLRLRDRLLAVRARGTGYLDIDCKVFIDVDDIDRYLRGELDTVGEIYAFPEDIKIFTKE